MGLRMAYWGIWSNDPAFELTYRVEWDEELLAFTASCLEYPEIESVSSPDGEAALQYLARQVSRTIQNDIAEGRSPREPVSARGTMRVFEDGEKALSRLLERVSLLAYRAKRDGDDARYRAYTDEWHALCEKREAIESYEFDRMNRASRVWRERLLALEPLAWPDPDQRREIHETMEQDPRKSDGDLVDDPMDRYACRQGTYPVDDQDDWQLAETQHDRMNDLSAEFIALEYRCDPSMDDYDWTPDDSPALQAHYRRLSYALQAEYSNNSRLKTPRSTVIGLIHKWTRDCFTYRTVLNVIDPSGDSTDTWEHLYDFTEQDRQRILASEISMPLLRHLLVAHTTKRMLDTVLEHHWTWAAPLYGLPDGWKLAFGPELIRDMQQIIDQGLEGFRITGVDTKFGLPRIFWQSDSGHSAAGATAAGNGQAGPVTLMTDLLFLYRLAAIRTCSRCGQFGDMSHAIDGLPACDECAADTETETIPEPAHDRTDESTRLADTIVYDTDTNQGIRPTEQLTADKRLKDINILHLLDSVDQARA
ncbi:hypothetical protein [Bifidobacterium miconisargentati]|uniref:hypothetical protein n=1 Tax=Bifidobacterium miconisargentati TaxID=2834437 RepID=UPI001BDDA0E7|nr:hypothetical protein [Bifidobacterium miconisargentati]MBW3090070.1 hypothetical protein [Bifidobacterium miconisargentati]